MVISRIKLLVCFILLTLIIGCVPAFATPIPTLHPNAIPIFIAQTADAASIQTLAAMPAFTSTATFTPTPRNTFTPEPTITPFQTFILSSPTPITELQYFRVKHDTQLARYDYKSRTADKRTWSGGAQTPEVVPLFVQPRLSTGTARTKLNGGWETLINALNRNNEAKLNYLKAPNSGLFNSAGFPQLESLTMGGNLIMLDEIRGEWGRVRMLDYGDPPVADTVNYVTRPDLVHKFVVVGWRKDSQKSVVINPPKGDLYWPFVSQHPVWIELSRLEKFPDLPLLVTANTTMYIQTTPGPDNGPTTSQLAAGRSAIVVEYHPSASSVWGRLQSGGWIPLLWYTSNSPLKYSTSWRMETLPPPPPSE